MRPLEVCRVAPKNASVRQAMVTASQSPRRTGAVMLVDESGVLAGLFTDSDLARLLETRDDRALDQPISIRMTIDPTTAQQGSLLSEAMAVMSHRRISELPVIDDCGRPIGMLDITDLVSLSDSSDAASILAMSNSTNTKQA